MDESSPLHHSRRIRGPQRSPRARAGATPCVHRRRCGQIPDPLDLDIPPGSRDERDPVHLTLDREPTRAIPSSGSPVVPAAGQALVVRYASNPRWHVFGPNWCAPAGQQPGETAYWLPGAPQATPGS